MPKGNDFFRTWGDGDPLELPENSFKVYQYSNKPIERGLARLNSLRYYKNRVNENGSEREIDKSETLSLRLREVKNLPAPPIGKVYAYDTTGNFHLIEKKEANGKYTVVRDVKHISFFDQASLYKEKKKKGYAFRSQMCLAIKKTKRIEE